jgi:hypothetical protein
MTGELPLRTFENFCIILIKPAFDINLNIDLTY